MKISKLQKKMGQFTLQIEELYLESGKVHGLIGTFCIWRAGRFMV